MRETSNYIGGTFGTGSGPEQTVINPATGETVWTYRADEESSVDAALAAAAKALPAWSAATPADRSAALYALFGEMEKIAEDLAQAESLQTGKPIRLAREFDVPGTIDNIAFFAGAARTLPGHASAEYSADHTSAIRRQAIGVVGSISPWNYPLQMAAWKILPAVAAGNTIVLKPAENTPLTTLMMAEACERAGFPAGVVNIVNGPGPLTGEAIVRSPQIAMTSFTGSTAVGRHIAGLAAQNGTRLHLELGGKAPFVVFDDADLEAAVQGAVAASLINTGQDCTAATRAYVHRSRYDDFVDGVVEQMQKVRLGAPSDPDTDQGPLVSFRQRDKVAGMVERAVQAGARAATGGKAPGGDLADGAYYEPTLIVDAEQKSEIVQDEVFGPVLVALPFDSDEEALELANDTPFGLGGAVFSQDEALAEKIASQLEVGMANVNTPAGEGAEIPFGGVKRSGFGRELGPLGMDEFVNKQMYYVQP